MPRSDDVVPEGATDVDTARWLLVLSQCLCLSAAMIRQHRKPTPVREPHGRTEDHRGIQDRRGRRDGRATSRSRLAPPASSTDKSSRAVGSSGSVGSVRRRRRSVGRPRKYNPAIPAHIDQSKLPKGIYWDNSGAGRWYIVVFDPDKGTLNTKRVASAHARLSVLRAIVRPGARDYVRGTVGWVMARFAESAEFAELSGNTQAGYHYCANVARKYKTQNGRGPSLDTLYVDRLRLPVIQEIIDTIGRGRRETLSGAGNAMPAFPSKANHLLRFFSRMFAWGIRHGHCRSNPAQGARQIRERPRSGMPTTSTYEAVSGVAQGRGALKPPAARRLPPYLWPLMEIKYLCRMRSIEVLRLTDAHASEQGVYVARRKRSSDNIVKWSPRLRAAWDTAVAARAAIWARPSNKARPTPTPERRFLFVTQTATPLSKAALGMAWRRLMRLAIEDGVITPEQRFTLHGLKHRGVTDTKGSRSRKQRASGHRTEAMVMLYDHDVPVVSPARPEERRSDASHHEICEAARGARGLAHIVE